MFPAVPHSFLRYAITSWMGFLGGMNKETSSVPLPSLLWSSVISFLVLYNLTESALLDSIYGNTWIQLEEDTSTETVRKAKRAEERGLPYKICAFERPHSCVEQKAWILAEPSLAVFEREP